MTTVICRECKNQMEQYTGMGSGEIDSFWLKCQCGAQAFITITYPPPKIG